MKKVRLYHVWSKDGYHISTHLSAEAATLTASEWAKSTVQSEVDEISMSHMATLEEQDAKILILT